MKSERVLFVVVAGIAVLVVVAGAVAALRPATEFDPGTPEAAVQGYLQAVLDGDEEEAEGFLASGSGCDAEDIERARTDESARVVLRDSEVEDGTAQVEVEIVFSSTGDPFDTYEYSEDRAFELVDEDGEWRLTDEPWPVFSCPEGS